MITTLKLFYRVIIRNVSDILGSLFIKNFKTSSRIVRFFKNGDLEPVLHIYRVNFGNNNSAQILKYSKLFKKIFFILELDGKISGYAGFYLHIKMVGFRLVKVATLYSIAVDPALQGKGHGTKLLMESINEMGENGVYVFNLYVNVKNEGALSVYKKIGFRIVENMRDICGAGEDCYKMCLDVTQ